MNTVDNVGEGQLTSLPQESEPHATWTFPVVVNGQAGVATVRVLPDVPYDDIVAYLIRELQSGAIALRGIV